MSSRVIAEQRISRLNDLDPSDGKYTLYWMQQSQRAQFNHALEFAVQRANENGDPLLVCFGLDDGYPDANRRHFQFMLEGLQKTADAIRRRKIGFVVQLGRPDRIAIELANDASELICDCGYLRHQRDWRENVAENAGCRVWQVESDVIVPVQEASDKKEYAARTIRSKLQQAADRFLTSLDTTAVQTSASNLSIDGIGLNDIGAVLDRLNIEQGVRPVDWIQGGTAAAKQCLKSFLDDSLSDYDDRSKILQENVSFLSPYLHFGHISPLEIALEVQAWRGDNAAEASFMDELLVRRELATNFVFYEQDYDSLKCLPDWASETLQEHEDDAREHQYTAGELEDAQTHDDAWNAAMTEMKHRGYLHNHLRMYWGKKIIEWTNTINHAYRVALQLNNKYFLDGRDANSYANVGWLFGLHDRAHQERPIFGKVRYMSADGLKRKFDVDQYIQRVRESHPQDRASADT